MRRLARQTLSLLLPAVLSAGACLPAWGADGEPDPDAPKDTLGLHLFSQHLPAARYNNVNPGVYYRLKEGPVAGLYRNSIRRASLYAGYTWQYGRFDLTTGVVTGYSKGAQVLLVPSVRVFTAYHTNFRLAFIPRVEKRIGSHVLHLAAEI